MTQKIILKLTEVEELALKQLTEMGELPRGEYIVKWNISLVHTDKSTVEFTKR